VPGQAAAAAASNGSGGSSSSSSSSSNRSSSMLLMPTNLSLYIQHLQRSRCMLCLQYHWQLHLFMYCSISCGSCELLSAVYLCDNTIISSNRC
jgi:hypothetical protein